MKKKVLIIVDPQKDFIDGTMTVEDAEDKMDLLLRHIKAENYEKIIITLDWHPKDHCSFKDYGGQWPDHCIGFTEGALPDKYLMEGLLDKYSGRQLIFVTKGKAPNIEEYGALDNAENTERILNIVKECDEVCVCGIMSEYCVLNTVKGLVNNGFSEKIKILFPFISTADDHKTLLEYANNMQLKYIDLKL